LPVRLVLAFAERADVVAELLERRPEVRGAAFAEHEQTRMNLEIDRAWPAG